MGRLAKRIGAKKGGEILEDQSERVVFFEVKIREKKGGYNYYPTILVYKYMKVINRLTSDPPPEKNRGVASCPLIKIPTLGPLSGTGHGHIQVKFAIVCHTFSKTQYENQEICKNAI